MKEAWPEYSVHNHVHAYAMENDINKVGYFLSTAHYADKAI